MAHFACKKTTENQFHRVSWRAVMIELLQKGVVSRSTQLHSCRREVQEPQAHAPPCMNHLPRRTLSRLCCRRRTCRCCRRAQGLQSTGVSARVWGRGNTAWACTQCQAVVATAHRLGLDTKPAHEATAGQAPCQQLAAATTHCSGGPDLANASVAARPVRIGASALPPQCSTHVGARARANVLHNRAQHSRFGQQQCIDYRLVDEERGQTRPVAQCTVVICTYRGFVNV